METTKLNYYFYGSSYIKDINFFVLFLAANLTQNTSNINELRTH